MPRRPAPPGTPARRLSLLPLVALGLAGCALTHRPPPSAGPAIASVHLEPRAPAAGLIAQPVPQAWWALFNDPLLVALQTEAGRDNLDLQSAAARVAQARAQLGLSEAQEGPQLGLGAGYTRQALSENSPLHRLGAPTRAIDQWQAGFQASWELDLWGHQQQLTASAQSSLAASRYASEALRVSIGATLARHYLLLRGVQSQSRLAEAQRRVATELLRLAESRECNGVSTRADTAAARGALAGIEAQTLLLRQQRESLLNAVAQLLAQPPRELDARLSTGAALPAMPQQLPVGLPSELARRRPDILQAEARLRAATADIGAAEADFYPRVSLGGSLGTLAYKGSDLGSWNSRQYSVGPTVYLPLFDGGRLQRMLALTEARQQAAAITYRQTVLRAWHEVDDALSAYAASLQRSQQLAQASAQLQLALQVAERARQEGAADQIAVLQARRALLSSQAALSEGATSAALSVVALYQALGGGWTPQALDEAAQP